MKVKELEINGTYVAVTYSDESIQRLLEYCDDNDIPNPLSGNEIHTTLVYSRVPVRTHDIMETIDPPWEATPYKAEVWDSPVNAYKDHSTRCLVLKLDAPAMVKRFNQYMDRGATYDFDEYKPHITLSYDVGDDFSLDNLSDPSSIGTLQVVSEYTEDLDLTR